MCLSGPLCFATIVVVASHKNAASSRSLQLLVSFAAVKTITNTRSNTVRIPDALETGFAQTMVPSEATNNNPFHIRLVEMLVTSVDVNECGCMGNYDRHCLVESIPFVAYNRC